MTDNLSPVSLALVCDSSGLSLRPLDGSSGDIRVDFLAGANRHRLNFGGGKGQQLAKAVGLDHSKFSPHIADLTAGLGRDAFAMASLGARVSMVERHPVVHALLADGLARAQQAPDKAPAVAAIIDRLSCVAGEGEAALREERIAPPDIIYLDPMFPPRSKSAKVKKEMQIFHRLIGFDDNGEKLLAAALEYARYRVVVKRPLHAPSLGGEKPALSLRGKSIRFDLYPLRKIP